VRITCQLIDVQTGGHVWSQRYDRDLKDIFTLQDEVTLAVMHAMRVKLTEGEQAVLWQKKELTRNLEAVERVWQCMGYVRQATKDANPKAQQLLEEAIALDPGYASAYAGLAWTHYLSAQLGWSKDSGESMRKAYEIANKALSLDDSLDIPHWILGLIYTRMGEVDKAIAEGEKAVELNPNGSDALVTLGAILVRTGRPAEAIEPIEKGIRLNPIPTAIQYAWLGAGYMFTNQYDRAIAILKKGLQVQPDNALCLIHLVATYSLAGRQEDASKTAAEFLKFNPKFSVEAWAKGYNDPAVQERLINALRQAGSK
jgi:adenylate cyclase